MIVCSKKLCLLLSTLKSIPCPILSDAIIVHLRVRYSLLKVNIFLGVSSIEGKKAFFLIDVHALGMVARHWG